MNNILSAGIGSLIAIMVLVNGQLSGIYGNFTALLIIHLVGLITITIIMVVQKLKFKNLKTVPWYFFTAGLIGIVTVLFNNITFTVLGVSLTLAIALLGQSVTSVLIDHYGLFGMPKVEFKKEKFFGLILILLGIIFMAIS